MADLLKTTIAAAGEEALTGLTEHGQVKIGISSNAEILVEQELDDDPATRGPVYQGKAPCVVVDYVGTKLWITNKGAEELAIRVGQV
jgi:hypothetical protein